jgi:hypothetical protein
MGQTKPIQLPLTFLPLTCTTYVSSIGEPNSGGEGSIRRFEDAASTPSKRVVKPSLILILALSSEFFSIHEGAPIFAMSSMVCAAHCGAVVYHFFGGGGSR